VAANKILFDQQDLPSLLRDTASRRLAGQLFLSKQSNQAVIYFGVGRILAAICQPLMGVSAIREVLTWESGESEFRTEMVLLSTLPRDSRVVPTLDEILGEISSQNITLEVASAPTMETLRATQHLPGQSQSREGQPISAAFIDQLELLLKQLVGPFGGVLLEDAAEEIGCAIEEVTSVNLQAWLSALKVLVPAERRQIFDAQLEGLLKKRF